MTEVPHRCLNSVSCPATGPYLFTDVVGRGNTPERSHIFYKYIYLLKVKITGTAVITHTLYTPANTAQACYVIFNSRRLIGQDAAFVPRGRNSRPVNRKALWKEIDRMVFRGTGVVSAKYARQTNAWELSHNQRIRRRTDINLNCHFLGWSAIYGAFKRLGVYGRVEINTGDNWREKMKIMRTKKGKEGTVE